MRIKLHQLILPIDYEKKDILPAAALKIGCREEQISDFKLTRRSIDARKRHRAPFFSLTVELELKDFSTASCKHDRDIEILDLQEAIPDRPKMKKQKLRPVVVGAGPSGLMAALTLSQAGLSPLLIERGCPVDERTSQVALFWGKGILNTDGNVLYGEGGAGLFSDGKLTARSKDRAGVKRFMETLVKCGAPEDILIDAEPHLGSNALKKIVPALRELIEKSGGEISFSSRLDGMFTDNGRLRGVIVNGKEIETENCILATGHSARDVYKMLAQSGVMLESKSFAVGVRLEIPQKHIDGAQWGKFAGHPRLGAASFRLTFKKSDKTRACYSFCMCPGGTVIPCASSEGEIITNGMSLSARSGSFGNAAFLVPVDPQDYSDTCPDSEEMNASLYGLEFQKKIESLAFCAGKSDYSLPATTLSCFLKNNCPDSIPENRSWHRSHPSDLNGILPGFVLNTLKAAIPTMLKPLKGVCHEEVVLYGPETRSSSPVRISRKENGESLTISGLFPCGEGSGYSGGIVSSAVDGIHAAEALIAKLQSNQMA